MKKQEKVFVKSVVKPSREEYDMKTDTWRYDFYFHFNLANEYFGELLNEGLEEVNGIHED